MVDSDDKTVSRADAAAVSPPRLPAPEIKPTPEIKPVPEVKPAPEIKVEAADALFAPAPPKDTETASPRKAPSFFGRFVRFVSRTAVVACLCGLAWLGWRYYALGHSPLEVLKPNQAVGVQQSPERDEMVGTVRQMAEEIRALKASVEGVGRPDAGAGSAQTQESLKNQLDAAQAATKAAIADLAARVDKLEAASTTKLSQVSGQLDTIEHQIATPHAAPAAAGQPPHKRKVHPHDAYDPSRDPAALGGPRPLGSASPTPIGQKAH